MRAESCLRALLLGAVLTAGAAAAQEPEQGGAEEDVAGRLPEHRARPLPADTFTPSEDISEDFPVPFPVDI